MAQQYRDNTPSRSNDNRSARQGGRGYEAGDDEAWGEGSSFRDQWGSQSGGMGDARDYGRGDTGYARPQRGQYREQGGDQYGNQQYGGGSGQGHGSDYYSQRQGQSMGYRGKGPKGYQRSDERLKEVICEMLTDDPSIDASDITITVKNGEVTLEGSVDDRRSKHCAEDIVDDCSGVKEVRNHLRVEKSQGGSWGEDGAARSSSSRQSASDSGNGSRSSSSRSSGSATQPSTRAS
jgi:osmotically-inducible protein OsmY